MISIQTPKGSVQRFKDEKELADFAAASFQKLSRSTVDCLRESLEQISEQRPLTTELSAELALQAARITVKEIESDKRAKRTPVKTKAPIPEAALKLHEINAGSAEFRDILPAVTQLHSSAVAVHDSMHTGPKKVRVSSTAQAHTATHVLGHLAQVIMYLPQLRPLINPLGRFLKKPLPGTGLPQASGGLWKPDSFDDRHFEIPDNPLAKLQSMLGSGGSLHSK